MENEGNVARVMKKEDLSAPG